jgi:NTP pyrophosphatase (non-canonical NTP hydrolase)
MHPSIRAWRLIQNERRRQDEKWGEQKHSPETLMLILMEEIGELSEALLHEKFGGPRARGVVEEATHVAATAKLVLEHIAEERKNIVDA